MSRTVKFRGNSGSMRQATAAAFRRFARDRDGSLAISFGLALPVLMLIVGISIDYGRFTSQSMSLAAAADAAALAAAKEMSLTDTATNDLTSVAKSVIQRQMTAQEVSSSAPPLTVTADIASAQLEVTVRAVQPFVPYFGIIAQFLPSEVVARSVARVVGKPNICVLALERSEPGAVFLAKSARMTGDGCSVFSNSSSAYGLIVRDNAQMKAKSVCSAGGVEGAGAIDPQAISDCPQFSDPLSSRPAPSFGGCDYNGTHINNQIVKLRPGVYCGGLKVDGSSTVTFESGEYIIENGAFWVSGTSKIEGDGVSFYLGDKTFMFFGPDTTLSLTTMRTGVMAGLLFFGSRNQSKIFTHTILSKNAQKLVGTIYLPKNSFVVDGEAAVGGDSAYTAIVARRLVLLAGPHLVLNSNYDQTDVPGPDGIRGATEPARLVQ